MKKRLFSRLMAMLMAVTLLSTTAFAASFSALQDAIDGKSDSDTNSFTADDGSTRYGYGEKNTETNKWGIEAWDEDGTRKVELNENVEFDKDGEDADRNENDGGIIVNGKEKNVSIELNGHAIDLNPEAQLDTETGNFYQVEAERDEDGKKVAKTDASGGKIVLDNSELNKGSVIKVTSGAKLTVTDSSAVKDEDGNYISSGTGIITGGTGTPTWGKTCGGGVHVNSATFKMEGGNISNNYASSHGGGVFGAYKVGMNMTGTTISDNYSGGNGGGIWVDSMRNTIATVALRQVHVENNNGNGGGGCVFASALNGQIIANISNQSVITGNHGRWHTGGVCPDRTAGGIVNYTIDSTSSVCNNTSGDEKAPSNNDGNEENSHVWSNVSAQAPTCTKPGHSAYRLCQSGCKENYVELPATGHQHTEIRGAVPAAPGVPGYTGDTYCTDCGELIQRGETIPALPMPVDFGDTTGGADTGTAIDDEATPLAGLFTRADAIGYLWEQSGSPEAELSTFADVPEDHYWAVAIGWAEDNGIALPDEEGNFRPDDLVLRTSDEPEGELQEFLNRYAVFAGVELEPDELFFVLDGAADDVIMGEDAQVIFDAFFAKLEKTLAEQEQAA